MHRSVLAFATILATGTAQAGILDLGSMVGNANIYTIGNFSAPSSDVEGKVVAGGNVNISSYSINAKPNNNVDTGGYALIAGGDVKLKGGSINNGKMYAGGNVDLQWAAQPPRTTENPIDFVASAAYYQTLSGDLSKVAATGSVSKLWSGVVVSGSGQGGVDVFNVSADMFQYSSSWTLDKLVKGQTLIFNVSGTDATFNEGGISFEPLSGYNVLFNFPDALTLNVKGIIGSVLAPNATVDDNWGVINGQVVVDTWNSTIQVNSNHYFTPVNLAGFRDTPTPPIVIPDDPIVVTPDPTDVPEPGTLALTFAGVGMALAARRVRRPAAQACA
ncbi:choice-of-anchor A family protein [Massilia sp. G4R7]|uniref:Choice-of-anchor A family protein n=1 Tax=Massilia phyllostachyos TaxID=2898585 RepID=A0ABS8Q329_9BURK|nr:choice-of-anchor A family protein [Massilia phyllostachyos]MCD2515497.1 choice-of-anchor A family protein [Massilia phyllostachyos]